MSTRDLYVSQKAALAGQRKRKPECSRKENQYIYITTKKIPKLEAPTSTEGRGEIRDAEKARVKNCTNTREPALPQSGRKQKFILWRNQTEETPDPGPRAQEKAGGRGGTVRRARVRWRTYTPTAALHSTSSSAAPKHAIPLRRKAHTHTAGLSRAESGVGTVGKTNNTTTYH